MSERKRTAAYYRGRDDAEMGAAPDYSQATTEQLNDYRDGYRRGLAERGTEMPVYAHQSAYRPGHSGTTPGGGTCASRAARGGTMRPTITQAVQRQICAECGTRPATPHPGDWIPYCAKCKREHARRNRKYEKQGE